jgi:FSR family fosmidomycin resistance protein-like MFS transporter
MTNPTQRVGKLGGAMKVALAIAVLHAANDAYTAFVHPLLPRLMAKLDMSIAAAAGATMALSIAASLAQPVLGHVSDRRGRRLMIVAGPIVSGIFLSMIGWAPTFGMLLLLLIAGGLGGAAFHPPAVAVAAHVTGGRGSGMRHAVFSSGGTVGYAMGPLIAVWIVAWLGFRGLWVAAIPVVILAIALYPVLPAGGNLVPAGPALTAGRLARSLRGPLGLLFGVSAIAAFFQRVFLTMAPIANAAAGRSEMSGAYALSLYLAAQAAGSLTGGYLTDRIDRRWLLAGLTLIALPTHFFAFWFTPGSAPALVSMALAGFANMSVLPPIVVIAQEIRPDRAALYSGIVMGLAWAVGSVAVIGAGVLGDAIGARESALAITPIMFIATLLAIHPALKRHGRPIEVVSHVT